MKLFPSGHATHPRWAMAAALVVAQLRAQMQLPDYASAPSLGLLYITDHYADEAQELIDYLRSELPTVSDWSGTVGVGVAANNAEYMDEPALSVLLLDVPADQYRVFSGIAPLPQLPVAAQPAQSPAAGHFVAHSALVHADGHAPDLPGLLSEMAERTASGYLFGGVCASRWADVQFAVAGAHERMGKVLTGGLSGVAFGADVAMVSRVTQGCQPLGRVQHRITDARDNVVLALDGEPALDVLLRTLGVTLEGDPQPALQRVRETLVGLMPSEQDGAASRATGQLSAEARVRHIIGLDAARYGIAVAEQVQPGEVLVFCQRNVPAARADLVRICAEIREELSPEEGVCPVPGPAADLAAPAQSQGTAVPIAAPAPGQPPWLQELTAAVAAAGHQRICGAVYVSCSGRGGDYFGGPSAELQLLRHALGDVPLVGFFAGGEIASQQLYTYTGVLTVFVDRGV